MELVPALRPGKLIRRYKRFLTDIELPDGSTTTIHCANTGSMKNCLAEGTDLWYSVSDNPKRKYPFTWEIATTIDGDLAGINTARPNSLVVEAIKNGVITELQGYPQLQTEVRYGEERSRIDVLLSGGGRPDCYVEVKNTTLCEHSLSTGMGFFPDSVSSRGTKHLRELALMVAQGKRAVLVFCVQNTGIQTVAPAAHIDPEYARTFYDVVARGVEVVAYKARVSPEEIVLTGSIAVQKAPE